MRAISVFLRGAIAAAAAFVAVNGAAAAEEPAVDEKAVVVLTRDNFDQHLEDHKLTLVEFYAPWCGHCKRLAPEYAAAAEILQGDKIPLAKVDATEESALATKYNVRGFPTIILFREKEAEEYTGGRTTDSIVQWVRRMNREAVSTADSVAAAKKAAADDGFAVVAVVKDEESDSAAVFDVVAKANRAVGSFYRVVDPSVTTETMRIYRGDDDFESEPIELTSADDLKEKVKAERLPFFGQVNGENFRDYVGSGLDLVWFAGSEQHYQAAEGQIREAAKQTRSKCLFLWLDTDKFGDHAVRALAVKDYPALVYQKSDDSSRYIFEEAEENKFPTKAVTKFVDDVLAGKIEKSLMSEPVPETNDEPVKVVVGKTFEEIVMDPKKDVLLEVYAPWCGHCKKFEPVYAEFAAKAAKNANLVVAKMDGTANESPVPDFEWRGFPTVFWVPAGAEKKPVQYDGARTLEGLVEWVTAHASEPFVMDADDDSEEAAGKDEL